MSKENKINRKKQCDSGSEEGNPSSQDEGPLRRFDTLWLVFFVLLTLLTLSFGTLSIFGTQVKSSVNQALRWNNFAFDWIFWLLLHSGCVATGILFIIFLRFCGLKKTGATATFVFVVSILFADSLWSFHREVHSCGKRPLRTKLGVFNTRYDSSQGSKLLLSKALKERFFVTEWTDIARINHYANPCKFELPIQQATSGWRSGLSFFSGRYLVSQDGIGGIFVYDLSRRKSGKKSNSTSICEELAPYALRQ